MTGAVPEVPEPSLKSSAKAVGARASLSDSLEEAQLDVVPVIADRRSPRANPTEETARRLSSSAFSLFDVHGFDAVTIADISAAAGVTTRTFYRYFSGKETLMLDVADQTNERLASLLARDAPGSTPRAVIAAALVCWYTELEDVLSETTRLTLTSPSLYAMQLLHSARWEERLASALRERFDGDLSEQDSLVWASMLFGLLRLTASEQSSRTLPERAEDWSRRFLELR